MFSSLTPSTFAPARLAVPTHRTFSFSFAETESAALVSLHTPVVMAAVVSAAVFFRKLRLVMLLLAGQEGGTIIGSQYAV